MMKDCWQDEDVVEQDLSWMVGMKVLLEEEMVIEEELLVMRMGEEMRKRQQSLFDRDDDLPRVVGRYLMLMMMTMLD